MARRFYKKGMQEFVDYYPVEKCMTKEVQQEFACPKCGHFEKRVELVEYNRGWLYDDWKIKCEKCGTISSHSG